jgi:hypothetical protein
VLDIASAAYARQARLRRRHRALREVSHIFTNFRRMLGHAFANAAKGDQCHFSNLNVSEFDD